MRTWAEIDSNLETSGQLGDTAAQREGTAWLEAYRPLGEPAGERNNSHG